MKVLGFIKKYYLPIVFSTLFGLFLSFSANAQFTVPLPTTSPSTQNPDFEFLVSWRAINFVPPDYQGKIVPSKNSIIEISFDLLDNGKFVDVSKQQINWNVDRDSFKSGVGLKSIITTFDKVSTKLVEIELPNYSDKIYGGAYLNKFVNIPAVSPEVVINAPYPNKTIGVKQNAFQAVPYFFGISSLGQLNFGWEVDGQKMENDPNYPSILALDLTSQGSPESGANILIKVLVKNITDLFEFAAKTINLNIK
ncbi:MAG: hypothetical protein Q7S81_00260 [bacterium]|nr:hypothetical protein [bacterium]